MGSSEQLRYNIAEQASDLTIWLIEQYRKDHGCYSQWDDTTQWIFEVNNDTNIIAEVERMGGVIHQNSIKFGLTYGITIIHRDSESFFHIMEHAEEPMDYDTRAVCYDNTIERISNFLFDFKE